MKKFFSVVILCIVGLTLTACSNNNKNGVTDYSLTPQSEYTDSEIQSTAEALDSSNVLEPVVENVENKVDSSDSKTDSIQEMKSVGTSDVGFVSVPDDWVKFQDVSGSEDFQYSDILGTSIITLSIVNDEGLTEDEKNNLNVETVAKSIWYKLEQAGVSNIEGASVKLKDYDALQVYGLYIGTTPEEAKTIVCWVFETEDGKIRYVSAEGPNNTILDVVNYVEQSYSLE